MWTVVRKLDKSKFEKSNSTKVYVNEDGEKKFQGTSKLQETQVYPPKFGRRASCLDSYMNSFLDVVDARQPT